MNYELTEKMVEYRPEHERLLYGLGLSGSAFKRLLRPQFRDVRRLSIFPQKTLSCLTAQVTSRPQESVLPTLCVRLRTSCVNYKVGFYRDVELEDPQPYHSDIEERKAEEGGFSLTDDNRYALYEVHVDMIDDGMDNSEEDIAKPYVVTIERGSGEILAIRRKAWNEIDPLQLKRQHFVHYVYVPGFGFYGLGLIHIIGGYAKAGTSLIRQLVDAGTLSNLPAAVQVSWTTN